MKKSFSFKTAGWYLFLPILGALLFNIAGCEKTVNEPGEPVHGGVFLHAPEAQQATTNP